MAAVLTTEPESRSRRRVCMALSALAKFAAVEVDLSRLRGGYSLHQVNPRELPDDTTISAWYKRIPNKSWAWFYGMLATYGLRPDEAFHLVSIESTGVIEVGADTKTGSRLVWPLFPEWVSEWSLLDATPPAITGKNNSALGDRSSQFFRRLGLPFKLYDLRHCWARRSLEFGLDISLCSQQMGHSLAVHSKVYQAWIDRKTHQKAMEALVQKADRPFAPKT
ncbi:hypothetical protein NG798_23910 [Ancylothrix sp. C2]|uniref:hypothetical protein n=1 Tax=Ancylothrix sp. D3o TaxID=2953691 RepID=UPI0021BB7511|nr:hypothetical protein [Ancylothrix sp. D3o]MCT7952850.1 hypothetical protein [Ancylothrix sp. D3o]